ncbi:236_t:CDS:2 [Cetraspora pellucida]|uniref:236_t:CDS:1 n=1 Tax=Cetraspora pellucida TaxID=1433469 RepID=A0A9N9C2K0_9GLOM|nr:236_t:CDS:2 [Cetraspora pellucida]
MAELPSDLIMMGGKLSDLIDFVYPNFTENSGNKDYFTDRAILTLTNNNVDKISDIMINWSPGEVKVYPSADSVNLTDDSNAEQSQLYPPEFLRSLNIFGIPSEGLCNGTCLICHELYNKVIDAEIITGSHINKRVFIPRITLTPSDTKLPFTLK